MRMSLRERQRLPPALERACPPDVPFRREYCLPDVFARRGKPYPYVRAAPQASSAASGRHKKGKIFRELSPLERVQ